MRLPRCTARYGMVWIQDAGHLTPAHARAAASTLAECCECAGPGERIDLAAALPVEPDALADLDPVEVIDALQFADALFRLASIAVVQEHAGRLSLVDAETICVRVAE